MNQTKRVENLERNMGSSHKVDFIVCGKDETPTDEECREAAKADEVIIFPVYETDGAQGLSFDERKAFYAQEGERSKERADQLRQRIENAKKEVTQ